MSQILLVFTNCPNPAVADTIARTLVSEQLAACVNVLAACQSFYQWQGDLCQEQEVPLLMKTTASSYPALEARLRELHPYELPEIVAVDVARGLPAYLDWVATQSRRAE